MDILGWIYYVVLVCLLIVGLALNIIGLPGLWLMVLSVVVFTWLTGWDYYAGWPTFWALFGLAVVAEIAEFAAGAAGSKAAGGSKRGMMGAVSGGLVGGIVGQMMVPIPVIGAILGALAGSFTGAAAVERLVEADSVRALKVGFGAAKGRLYGIVIKALFGVVMAIVALFTCLPYGGATPAVAPAFPAAPGTSPATIPTEPM